MTTPMTTEQMVSSDTIDAYHLRIKLAYDLYVADCDDHDQAMLRASVAAATFAMSSADAARYARRQLPQSGGYACDDDGIIPADTVRTIAETDYNHEQAMNAIASLLRSHEVLRTRADAAERRVEARPEMLVIPASLDLDQVRVFFVDHELGRGTLVISCYDEAWSCYFGAMGKRTLRQFVASVSRDYLGNAMRVGNAHYRERIANAVILACRDSLSAASGAADATTAAEG